MASSYLKNTLTLLSGIGIGQLLSFASLPFLSRLYSTSQLGEYFLIYSISVIGSALFSLQSHLIIVRSNTVDDARSNLAFSILINALTVIVFFAGLMVWLKIPFLYQLIHSLGYKVLYCPFFAFLLSTQFSFDNYLNFNQKYKKLRQIKILRILIMVVLQLALPFFFDSSSHLLVLSQLGGLISISAINWSELQPFKAFKLNVPSIVSYYSKNSDILVMSTGISILSAFSINLPYVFFGFYFGSAETGYYGMAQRIIGTPLNLFGESMGVVFYQKGAQLKNCHKRLLPLLKKTLWLLFKYGIGPILLIIAFAKPVLLILLGREWEMTGSLLQILSPMLFLVYINSAVSYLISILKIQKRWLMNEAIQMILRVLALWIGFKLSGDFLITVACLSAAGIILNVYFAYYFYRHTNAYDKSLIGMNDTNRF
jgi:O-antigen/teichoic acid export membrane protein